jgi:hypothetical protein
MRQTVVGICHSRAGGNPAGLDVAQFAFRSGLDLDSRLRGNDILVFLCVSFAPSRLCGEIYRAVKI